MFSVFDTNSVDPDQTLRSALKGKDNVSREVTLTNDFTSLLKSGLLFKKRICFCFFVFFFEQSPYQKEIGKE